MKADLNAAARRERVLRYASYGLMVLSPPKPKRKEIERIPVDHSRLLDAITEPYQDKQRRRAISYTTEIEKG